MLKIGITGHNSFLGRHLVSALKLKGHEIITFNGDIRNPAQVSAFVKKCNTIFHLAGCNRGTDKDVYETNMIGGANIAAASASFGNKHIIFPSSNYLLRASNNPYSIGKKAIEDILKQLDGYNKCRSTVLRLTNTYGPLALPFHVSVVATFCWYEANGFFKQMPIAGDGSQTIELVPVQNVIDRFINASENSTSFSLTELRGDVFSIKELSETIHDPIRRKAYPTLVETVNFFSKPCNLQVIKAKDVTVLETGFLKVKLNHDHVAIMKEFDTLNLQPGFQRYVYQYFTDKCLIYLANGKVALDLFSQDEEYLNTILIDGKDINCVEISPEYKFKIRNLYEDTVNIKYCRETEAL